MSQNFDPYLQWLGIRDSQRPPNHYRLLGLELFESNEGVIANAADRQMAHVRTFQTGQHADLSQQVLNELAAARVCLLKTDKKAAYDKKLRAKLAAAKPAPAIPQPAPVQPVVAATATAVRPVAVQPVATAAASPFDEIASAAASSYASTRARRKRKPQKSLVPYALAAIVLLAGTVTALVALKPEPQPVVASNPPAVKPGEPTPVVKQPAAEGNTPDAKPNDPKAATPVRPPVEAKSAAGDESGKNEPPAPVIEDVKPAIEEVATNDTGTPDSPADLPDEKEDEDKTDEPPTPPSTPEQPVAAPAEPKPDELPHIGPRPLDTALLAVPSEEDRKAALDRIREVFGKDMDEARTAEARKKLAKMLLDQAAAAKADSPVQFVLLNLVKDLGVSAEDIALAEDAIDRQAGRFAVEPIAAKYEAIVEINRHARNADSRAALVPAANQLVDAAIERGDFELAQRLNKFVQQSATKARDRELMKSTLARDKSLREMQRQQETALAARGKVKADPNDAKANLALGAYLCFVKQDWDDGLLRLSKSNHPLLQDVALQELAKPSDAKAQKQLGDMWLKCAEDKTLAQWTDGMKARAREHYQQSVEQLSGLDKAEVEKTLEKLSSVPEADQSGSPGGAQVTIKLPGGVPMTFRRIPAGKFVMGSPPNEPGRNDNETQHLVTITKPFYLGVTEVTQAQWMAVMRHNPSAHQGDPNLPVENISWNDAVQYCEMATKATGGRHRFRLPTEAEWEYACRAGSRTPQFFNPSAEPLSTFAWYKGNSRGQTHPAGQLKPNLFGLFDILGNVSEWCWDFSEPYTNQPQVNPTGPAIGTDHAYRGGNSRNDAIISRSAFRNVAVSGASTGHPYLGLRVVVEVQ